MPTTQTRYINLAADPSGNGTTRALSSGDNTHAYQTFNAAQVAEAKSLVSSDEIFHFKCAGATGEGNSSTAITLSASWATDATRYIIVDADTDHPTTPMMHTGVADDNLFHFRYVGTAGGIDARGQKVIFRNLQFYAGGSASINRRALQIDSTASNYAAASIVENCLFDGSRLTGAESAAILLSAGSSKYTIVRNSLFINWDMTEATYACLYCNSATANVLVYNCTFVDSTYAIRGFSTYSCTVKNCLFENMITADGDGAAGLVGNNNASTNSSSIGTSPRVSQTFTFADGAYRLAAGDAGALGHGIDLSGDANSPITTDWEGDARDDPPDIGWDEYIAPAAGDQFTEHLIRVFV